MYLKQKKHIIDIIFCKKSKIQLVFLIGNYIENIINHSKYSPLIKLFRVRKTIFVHSKRYLNIVFQFS